MVDIHLEKDFCSVDVANASNSSLVHQDASNRFFTGSHLVPQPLTVCILPQGIWTQLARLVVVVVCIIQLHS